MKIIFFGTPDFATPSLEILAKIPSIKISLVITQPDKAIGRKKTLTPPPVKVIAKKFRLKVVQPKTKSDLKKALKNIKADFFIVIAYGMILPKEIIEIPKYGTFNVHASLLPKYRGASPIQAALLNGDKQTGISIFKIDEKLDHGPIFMIKRLPIEKEDNLQTLKIKLANLSKEILPLALEDIENGQLTPIPQNHSVATYCEKIQKSDGKINWGKSADHICNMIKAYTPWPSAYTELNNKKIKILQAETEESKPKQKPGTFILENKTLKIATKKGYLIPKKLQLEGKKEMDVQSFVNGYKHLF
jgi:methionyl-tRNA formyltransferase